MLRANATYWLGRAAAAGADHTRIHRLMHGERYRRAERSVQRWGAPLVTLCFLTVGVQTLVNLAAGAARMPQRRYLPAVVAGGLLWAGLYSTAGMVGWTALVALYELHPTLLIVLLAVAVAASVVAVAHARRRAVTEQVG